MKKIITATAAVLMCTVSAMADLTGTALTVSVNHAGAFNGPSAINNQSYTYGSPSTFTALGWGDVAASSPAVAPGFNNAIKLDFTNFQYNTAFVAFPTTGTVKLTDIDEAFDLASVQVLASGMNIALGPAAAFGNGFQATWSTASVFAANPVTPNVIVAWNSVPSPGALALMGLAGLIATRRRRSNR